MIRIVLPLLLLFLSCSRPEVCMEPVHLRWADQDESIDALYNDSVTVIRKKDTTITISHRYDTAILETGIFSYLQHSFPMIYQLNRFTSIFRLIIEAENNQDSTRARHLYDSAIYFYHNQRPLDLELFSDLNGLYMYEVNAAILCSYAYEKTGNLDQGLKIMKPYMANRESENSNINLRYIELCISKYGVEEVRSEIMNAHNSLYFARENNNNYDWRVKLFGADIAIPTSFASGAWVPTKGSTDSMIKTMIFYNLIK